MNAEWGMVECLIFIISAILIRVGAAFSRDKYRENRHLNRG